PLTRRYFVFFFNNPAPPELSTLSLHDALPISAPRYDRRSEGLDRHGRSWRSSARRPCTTRRRLGLDRTNKDRARQTESSRPPRRDRKSTRLNSSHDQISYAVFCLKKKKKKKSK